MTDSFLLGLVAGFGLGALVALCWAASIPPRGRRVL